LAVNEEKAREKTVGTTRKFHVEQKGTKKPLYHPNEDIGGFSEIYQVSGAGILIGRYGRLHLIDCPQTFQSAAGH